MEQLPDNFLLHWIHKTNNNVGIHKMSKDMRYFSLCEQNFLPFIPASKKTHENCTLLVPTWSKYDHFGKCGQVSETTVDAQLYLRRRDYRKNGDSERDEEQKNILLALPSLA